MAAAPLTLLVLSDPGEPQLAMLERFLRGEPLKNVVEKRLGY